MGISAMDQRYHKLKRPLKQGEARRMEIYHFIVDYANEKDGPTPSINEIKANFDWCKSYATAYYHVMKMIADGLLRQEDNKLVVVDSEWIPPIR